MDTVLLSRAQFAANMSFHILFPAINIALGWMLLYFRWRWLKTRDAGWIAAYRFWTKVFALSFALGVVSGLTMSFQFGTNWPGYMRTVGNIAGPLLGYEVLTAFFLEASFLGIMLFGHGRVSERLHFVSTLLVASGTTLSAFWILCLNSWMQTPVGYEVRDGVFHATSWLAILTNPSFPPRLAHMLIASLLTVCFLMAGVSAWQLLRGTPNASTARVLRLSVSVAAVMVPVQILVGDLHGLNTLEHQPQKVAAIEGIWHTERGAPLLLFAWPDEKAQANRYAIGIPRAGSLILTHDPEGEIKGLNEFPNARPPAAPLFYGFRVMVGIGLLMLVTSWTAWWIGRHRSWNAQALPRRLLWALAAMTYSGWVAVLAGWYVTEIGRQPYIVFGLVRTADVAADLPSAMVASTLAMYIALYVVLVLAYIAVIRYLAEKAEPEEAASADLHSSAAVARTVGHAT